MERTSVRKRSSDLDELVSATDACRIIGMHYSGFLQNIVDKGRIPVVMVAGKRLYRLRDVKAVKREMEKPTSERSWNNIRKG